MGRLKGTTTLLAAPALKQSIYPSLNAQAVSEAEAAKHYQQNIIKIKLSHPAILIANRSGVTFVQDSSYGTLLTIFFIILDSCVYIYVHIPGRRSLAKELPCYTLSRARRCVNW